MQHRHHATPAITNEAGLLQSAGSLVYSGTADAQHAREGLLGQQKLVRAHPIVCHQEPARQRAAQRNERGRKRMTRRPG